MSGNQKLTPAGPHTHPLAHRQLQHYNNPVFVENLVNKEKYTVIF